MAELWMFMDNCTTKNVWNMFEILFNGQTTYHLVHGFARQWCFYSEYAWSSRSNILIFKSFLILTLIPGTDFPSGYIIIFRLRLTSSPRLGFPPDGTPMVFSKWLICRNDETKRNINDSSTVKGKDFGSPFNRPTCFFLPEVRRINMMQHFQAFRFFA